MDTMTIYRCPSCGGEISFDSSEQKLVCPYCDTSFEVETLKEYEKQLLSQQDDKMDWQVEQDSELLEDENIIMYTCENCGGQIIGDRETIATSCPYCSSPIIMNKNVEGQLRPDYVIPFKLNKNDAKKQLLAHFKGKPFLPKNFKEDSKLDEVKGIYVPFWAFNCRVDAKQQYRATKVSHYSDRNYNYTKTKHYLITREGTVDFDGVPVDGSSKIDDEYMQSIEPFNYQDAVSFEMAYLAGYFADKYDEDSTVCEPKANQRIKTTTENVFAGTVNGYTTKIIERSNLNLENKHVDYYLLPVWILNLKWNGKIYPMMMNGQTGKLIGDLPADMKQFWIFTAIVFVIVTLVFLVVLTMV